VTGGCQSPRQGFSHSFFSIFSPFQSLSLSIFSIFLSVFALILFIYFCVNPFYLSFLCVCVNHSFAFIIFMFRKFDFFFCLCLCLFFLSISLSFYCQTENVWFASKTSKYKRSLLQNDFSNSNSNFFFSIYFSFLAQLVFSRTSSHLSIW
jgi:hypothetical protein